MYIIKFLLKYSQSFVFLKNIRFPWLTLYLNSIEKEFFTLTKPLLSAVNSTTKEVTIFFG